MRHRLHLWTGIYLIDRRTKILKDDSARKLWILVHDLLELVAVSSANIDHYHHVLLVGETFDQLLFHWKKLEPGDSTPALDSHELVKTTEVAGVIGQHLEDWLSVSERNVNGTVTGIARLSVPLLIQILWKTLPGLLHDVEAAELASR